MAVAFSFSNKVNSKQTILVNSTEMVSAAANVDLMADSGADGQRGVLIVNADDWGRDWITTQRIRECVMDRSVSSVSAMVFMADSERAAIIAGQEEIDAGLHLNFTTPFSDPNCPALLKDRQREICEYLRGHRLARGIFHPGLMRSFDYVVAAQMGEFRRLYQRDSNRIDGHHHMHLCANVLHGKLLPAGIIVRRNDSFLPSENLIKRLYRQVQDRILAQRYFLVDFFTNLAPLSPAARLDRVFSLSRKYVVELETHPVKPEEYRFLKSGEIFQRTGHVPIASRYTTSKSIPQALAP